MAIYSLAPNRSRNSEGLIFEYFLKKFDSIFKGKNKEAGIALWKAGLANEAREQFSISGDTNLIDFIDRLQGRDAENLDAEIVRFFVDFDENDDAQKLILDVLKQDLEDIREKHKWTKNKLKEFKEKKNGK